ncbi:hypothetical protein [Cupriavidus pauculus]|uniref:hypothetical protein n=1 Tax=Cupriavidus pauculus TaxID=82633 RepID=UPI0021554D4C|nr:hypothetical protein [Cupriavidus pauculus]
MLDTMLNQFPPLEQEALWETCLCNGVTPDGFAVTTIEDAAGAAPAHGHTMSVGFGREIRQYYGNHAAPWAVDFDLVTSPFVDDDSLMSLGRDVYDENVRRP